MITIDNVIIIVFIEFVERNICMSVVIPLGDNAYTLNERLFAIPIHGPETPCSVCRTKRESEYEAEGSYVRYVLIYRINKLG